MNQQKNTPLLKGLRFIFTTFMFLAINYLVFLGFMNVCFENLVPGQPVYITGISLTLLAIDWVLSLPKNRKKPSANNYIDLCTILALTLSFALYQTYKHLVYLQIFSLLKIKSLFPINNMIYELVKKNTILFKTYVVSKIIYWILLAGHIIGCIFYALDLYLIKTEYFGPLALNPSLYYQGELHAYSSIYALSEQWRYVYAVYFSFSLLSTVAFGDIIGHNYLQDILVSFFLIASTICISLIIQQMIIVFKKQKTRYYELITNIKYASEFIKSQPDITDQFRYELVKYMISSQWRQITQIPKLELLTLKLQQSIFQQSILSKTDQNLPEIIKKFFLPLLKVKYYPVNYFIVDNNSLNNHIFGTIILHAKAYVGYTKQLYGKKSIKKQSLCFGFDEIVMNSNYLNRYLTVQLAEQAQVFVVSDDEFQIKMDQFRGYYNEQLPTPIEYYQSAKENIMFNTKEKQQCSSCKIKGHTLLNCRKFHYNPSKSDRKYFYSKKFNQERKLRPRKRLQSIKNTSRKSLVQLRNQKMNNPLIYLKIMGDVVNKNFHVQNLLNKTIQKTLQNLRETSNTHEINRFQGYFKWKQYSPDGQFQN